MKKIVQNSFTNETGLNPTFWLENNKSRPLSLNEIGNWKTIDTLRGFFALSQKYSSVWPLQEGLAGVQKEGMWGFIDKTGNEIITPKYQYVGPFQEGLAGVQKEGMWGFIDKTGNEIITPKYQYVGPFQEGLARVQKDGKSGFIDQCGQTIVPCFLDNSMLCAEHTYLLYRSNKKGLFYTDEKTYIAPEYEEIAQPRDPWVMVQKDGKWGWVDHRGNVIIPCRYDAATQFNSFDGNGYATVLQFGMQFRINSRGEMILRLGPEKE